MLCSCSLRSRWPCPPGLEWGHHQDVSVSVPWTVTQQSQTHSPVSLHVTLVWQCEGHTFLLDHSFLKWNICICFRLAMVYTSAGADIKRIILRALENPVSQSYRIPYFFDKFIDLWSCMGQEVSSTYWYLKFCFIGEKIFICKCSVSMRYNLYGHILCSCTCAWISLNEWTRWLDPQCNCSHA